jgi:hypothetical protein
MMLLVKFCTIFAFVIIHEETGAEINAIATAYEGNDLFRIALSLDKIGFIITVIVLPAALMALYLHMRRKVREGKVDIATLEYYVYFTFFALLINITNDGAGLLGKLAGGN